MMTSTRIDYERQRLMRRAGSFVVCALYLGAAIACIWLCLQYESRMIIYGQMAPVSTLRRYGDAWTLQGPPSPITHRLSAMLSFTDELVGSYVVRSRVEITSLSMENLDGRDSVPLCDNDLLSVLCKTVVPELKESRFGSTLAALAAQPSRSLSIWNSRKLIVLGVETAYRSVAMTGVLAFLTWIVCAASMLWRTRGVQAELVCARCGYLVRAHDQTICPECGAV